MKIARHVPAPAARIHELHENLVAAGQALRESDLETFLLTICSENGLLTAGCKGEIAYTSAHISEIWVSEQHRGKGLGRALLEEAEELARERQCMRVHLETRSKDARRLYERRGYRIFGELANYKDKDSLYYLEKRLG